MSDIQDCIELAIRGWEVNIHNSDERLMQVYRDDMIDWFEANSILQTKKKGRLQTEMTNFYMAST